MTGTESKQIIKSRILKTDDINWQDLKYLQSDEFKDFSTEEEQKLRHSIANNQFTDPFKVWFDESSNTLYCLDGKHRSIILKKLMDEGITVPELLPATFVQCDNMQEAAKLVLQYCSSYARTTPTGLMDFMDTYQLTLEAISLDINIPEIDLKTLFGDLDKDFSASNSELNLDEFKDTVVLELSYTREDYIKVKQRINELMVQHKVEEPEALIKILLNASI